MQKAIFVINRQVQLAYLALGKKTFQNGKYKVTQFLQQHLHFGLTVIAKTAEGTEGSQSHGSREALYQRTCQAGFQYPTR